MSETSARSWTAFWEHGQGFSCLPESRAAHDRLAKVWHDFASALPRQARIIDLACGSGAAARRLHEARSDLSIIGVDYARLPPLRAPGFELIPGVSLERLPFESQSFDGAISQFGIEYADRSGAASEASRILRAGAPVALIMHHAESPVVAHNMERERVLALLTGADLGKALLDGDRAALGQIFAALRSENPGQDVVREFEQGLGAALAHPPHARAETWQHLTTMVAHERQILLALAQAAVADCAPWLEQLKANFAMEPPTVIATASGSPLAWLLRGSRR